MNVITKKLRRTAGESLVETLASILVIALAAAILCTAAVAAGRINKTADTATNEIYAEMTAIETESGAKADGSVIVDGKSVNVTYIGTENGLMAYVYQG